MDHVVDIALRQGRLLARLVDELLSVARIQAGRMELHLEEVDLVALTKEAVATVADDLARAACLVTLQATGAIRGRWDRPRLLQVVVNLLTNAARHAPGAPVRIRVDASPTSATLEVRDQGQGIPLPLQARIFERFERATPHGDQGGLGLGLYISMEIVRAHGGGLRVDSDVGAGAAFIVSLPYGD